ncbi:MAG: NUDIX hydrolase [Betaproteobacteria bacterium]|nr:NUDIX hydrolase [Betaproteobacteria bacterium]
MKQVRRRVSVVVVHEDRVLGFYAEDPHNKRRYFFIPGGKIEEGESSAHAAVRETLEETGYQIEILPEPVLERTYDFEWDGQINDCRTTFLCGRLLNPHARVVNDAAYHRGVAWIAVNSIDEVFAYHNDICEPVRILAAVTTK